MVPPLLHNQRGEKLTEGRGNGARDNASGPAQKELALNMILTSTCDEEVFRISSALLDATVDSVTKHPMAAFSIEGFPNVVEKQALVDSGANAIFVSKQLVGKYSIPTESLKEPRRVTLADNSSSTKGEVTEYADLVLSLVPDIKAKFRCYVAEIAYPMILGGPVWHRLNPKFDMENGTCVFDPVDR